MFEFDLKHTVDKYRTYYMFKRIKKEIKITKFMLLSDWLKAVQTQ